MKVALFLHAYQPPTQFAEITEKIIQESYLPIVEVLLKNKQARLTLNLAGSLAEQLRLLDASDLIQKIQYLVSQGQIELVGTAAFHPLLTVLPEREVIRQSQLNERINKDVLGEGLYQPKGYFLPEMVYERKVAETIATLGYEWILLDESAYPQAAVEVKEKWDNPQQHLKMQISNELYQVTHLPLYVFFRDRPISLSIAFSKNYSMKSFIRDLQKHYLLGQESFVVLAMDAETFGHHVTNNLSFLTSLMNDDYIQPVRISELISFGYTSVSIEPLRSTWGVTLEDSNQKRTFPRWDNPDNPVHQLQWQLFNTVVSNCKHLTDQPDSFDRSLHSDQFWWAGHNPCWHPEMVRRGAQMMVEALRSNSIAPDEELLKQAEALYGIILETGEELFGSRIVPC